MKAIIATICILSTIPWVIILAWFGALTVADAMEGERQ